MIERPWSSGSLAPAPGAALDPLDHLDEVEGALMRLAVGTRLDRLGRMVQEHLDAGGKRMRARLALAAGEALGLERAEMVHWAAAVELLHNATLVHDDLQDGDARRRGSPTVWAQHGAAQAINVGDLLLTLPYLAVRGVEGNDALRWRLAEAIATAAEATVRGQSLELDLLPRRKLGWHDWTAAARGKSGALLALPVHGAALMAGLDRPTAETLAGPFASLGVLYQVIDDRVDLWGDKGRGAPGNDLREGKVSAPVVAHLQLHPRDEPELVALLERPREQTTDAAVEEWIRRFEEGGARDAIDRFADHTVRSLLDEPVLKSVPALHALAAEVVARVRG
ncbi:MAG: polyprenyl synthetase family protein [Myxococcota bacterium]